MIPIDQFVIMRKRFLKLVILLNLSHRFVQLEFSFGFDHRFNLGINRALILIGLAQNNAVLSDLGSDVSGGVFFGNPFQSIRVRHLRHPAKIAVLSGQFAEIFRHHLQCGERVVKTFQRT